MAPTKVQRKPTSDSLPMESVDSTDTPPKGKRSYSRLLAAGFIVNETASEQERYQPAVRTVDPHMQKVRTTLQDGHAKILKASAGNFEETAVSAFGAFKRSVSQSSELQPEIANQILSDLSDKTIVLKFLCRMAKEKRMYSKQVKLTLDMLLKCPSWRDAWQQSADLLKDLPDNLSVNYKPVIAKLPSDETPEVLESCPASSEDDVAVALQASASKEEPVSADGEKLAAKLPSGMFEALDASASSSKDKYTGSFAAPDAEPEVPHVEMGPCSPPAVTASVEAPSSDETVESAVRCEQQELGKPDEQEIGHAEDLQEEKVDNVVDYSMPSGLLPAEVPAADTPLIPTRIRKRDRLRAFFGRAFPCLIRA